MRNIAIAVTAAPAMTACGDSTPATTSPAAQQARPVDAVDVTITDTVVGTGEVTVR